MFSSTCTLLVHAIVNTDKKKAELIEMGFFFFKNENQTSFLFSVIKILYYAKANSTLQQER